MLLYGKLAQIGSKLAKEYMKWCSKKFSAKPNSQKKFNLTILAKFLVKFFILATKFLSSQNLCVWLYPRNKNVWQSILAKVTFILARKKRELLMLATKIYPRNKDFNFDARKIVFQFDARNFLVKISSQINWYSQKCC